MTTFSHIATAWRGVLHVSEFTGLSVGAVVGLGVLIYLDPLARRFAIAGIVATAILYSFSLYFYRLGSADIRAEWHAAKVAQEQVQKDADRNAAASETALESAIEAKAKAQHEQDLAEIERLKGTPVCAFGDDDASGLRNGSGKAPAKPAAGHSKAFDKSAAKAAPHENLLLSLVRRFRLQGAGHEGDASANGK